MPAQDTAPVPDKAAVRVLAAAVGQREAARRLQLSENTVKSICYRAGDGKAVAATEDTRVQAAHPNAPKPPDAMLEALAEDERETRSSLSKSARASARNAESGIRVETAADLASLAKAYSVIHRIEGGTGGTVGVAIQVNIG